ncbi:effector-binding domain-containing protein [Mesonia phycicola]|uniref:Effector-binding domain-containing protein n=1 Tax=Mesonia phycicola TaxID=579105 RepID=A0A1M6GNB6_9FLAO|nr:GyrI-like domain-containing protein [Mesonia phycicola]SHJ11421.1 effector-binding domain-containing protein [Mesonia phycicola]
MKIFKYIFFLLLIIIIGGSIYIATLDGNYQIEETKVVKAPVTMVFNEINDFKNWEKWSSWANEDNNTVFNYTEKTKGEGASLDWVSEDFEDGKIQTIEVIPNKSIHQEITLKMPFSESTSTLYWLFETIDGSTKVTWGIEGERSFFDKILLLIQNKSIPKELQPKFKQSLTNLDKAIALKMKQYNINIDGITEYASGYYMYITTASKNTPEALSNKMNNIFPEVANFMQKNNIKMSGHPLTIYNEINEANGTVIISCGIPTPVNIDTPEDSMVFCSFLPNTKAIKATLKGNYSNLPEAWSQLTTYLEKTDFEKNTEINSFEVYITDPETEPNPANWETEIYIPIQQREKLIDSIESL